MIEELRPTMARKVRGSRIVRDRGRSAVLGMVEEGMRALIDRGIKPTMVALKEELGPVGSNSIRRARAELVAAGIVKVPDGLERMSDDLDPSRLSPEEVAERAARVIEERLARARGLCEPDLFDAGRRPPHRFAADVRRVLGAERRLRRWSAAGRGREESR